MKPILFNTEMVRAILDGRKTATRRVCTEADDIREFSTNGYAYWMKGRAFKSWDNLVAELKREKKTYMPGDILWVRETWAKNAYGGYFYKADGKCEVFSWHPSIHMPKEAARLFLRVTAVRVERLQDITESQAADEGTEDPYEYQDPAWYDQHGLPGNYVIDAFAGLWDSTIKPADRPRYGWEANPFVWVIEFERISEEAALGGGGDG